MRAYWSTDSILVPLRRHQRHTQGLCYGVSLPDADRVSHRHADYHSPPISTGPNAVTIRVPPRRESQGMLQFHSADCHCLFPALLLADASPLVIASPPLTSVDCSLGPPNRPFPACVTRGALARRPPPGDTCLGGRPNNAMTSRQVRP